MTSSPARIALRWILALTFGALCTIGDPRLAAAQEPAAGALPATVNLFLDCTAFCDETFLRTDIAFVNWVRDRAVADVHLLVTSQGMGGGGSRYTLAFLGLRDFGGNGDTLYYSAAQTNTADITRRGLSRVIKLGLARFVAQTAVGERMTLVLGPAAPPVGGAAPAAAQATRDPWNYWVFTISGSSNTNGEKQSSSLSLNGSVTARRVTDQWKINLSARQSYSQSRFKLPTRTSKSTRRSNTFSELAVKSLGPRTSAGVLSSVGSSSFDNKKFFFSITPAVEYDIYPYTESTRRTLTARYSIGIERDQYVEETIYQKTSETLPIHTLSISLNQNQPWGSANVGISGSQFLNMTAKNSASINAGCNIRIVRGLSFSLSGSFSSIHNQLSLPRRGASEEEVLLQQRRLATNYSYFGFFSVNYTFGSIFNNVVNPRFGGA